LQFTLQAASPETFGYALVDYVYDMPPHIVSYAYFKCFIDYSRQTGNYVQISRSRHALVLHPAKKKKKKKVLAKVEHSSNIYYHKVRS
jgi:hypothetical protein